MKVPLDPEARPRLAAKARVRTDRLTGKVMLLVPERGLLLDETAAEVLALCDGARRVSEIAAELCAGRPGADPGEVERDVAAFLGELAARNLLARPLAAPHSPSPLPGGEP